MPSDAMGFPLAPRIVSNSVYLGVQLEMAASNPHLAERQQELFFAVICQFVLVFSSPVFFILMLIKPFVDTAPFQPLLTKWLWLLRFFLKLMGLVTSKLLRSANLVCSLNCQSEGVGFLV